MHKLHIVQLLIAFLFFGCVKNEDFDYDKVAVSNWQPELAMPLVYSDLSMKDLVAVTDSGNLISDSNHLVSLVYWNDVYEINADDILTIPYQEDNQIIRLNSNDSITLYSSDVVKSVSNQLQLNIPAGAYPVSVALQGATLEIEISSFIPLNGSLNISIPTISLNGIPFSKDINYTYSGFTPTITSASFDLSGYIIDLSSGTNEIGIFYSATFFQQTNIFYPITNLDFKIKTSIDQVSTSIILGDLGDHQLSVEDDTTEITFFNNFQSGSIYFKEPRVTFYLSNSLGIPVSLNINSITGYNNNGISSTLTGYPSIITIPQPSQPGETKEDSLIISSPPSNLDVVFGIAPNYIVYSLVGNANSTSNGFLTSTGNFKAKVKIDLPLKGYATGFTIQDTATFTLEEQDNIQSASFRLNFINGFPCTTFNQIYFTDDSYNILDSLFYNMNDGKVESAQIDNNGKVIASTSRTTDVLCEGEKLRHIFDSKKILIKSFIQTKDAPNRIVEIYDYYNINVRIGVYAKYLIK